MIEAKDLLVFAKEQREISVAQVQMHFEETYSHARCAVERLVEGDYLKYEGGITYKFVDRFQERKSIKSVEDEDVKKEEVEEDEEVDEELERLREKFNDMMRRRARDVERRQIEASARAKRTAPQKSTKKQPSITKQRREEMKAQIKESFDKLSVDEMTLLQSALIENSQVVGRGQLYIILREKGDELPTDSKEYATYNGALSFLLQLPDDGFEEFKKYAMSKI